MTDRSHAFLRLGLAAITGVLVAGVSPHADAAATHEVVVPRMATPWYVPPHTDGDAEYYGHGPRTTADVVLVVRDGNQLWAEVNMRAVELGNDPTTAAGRSAFRLLTLPGGNRIEAILSPTRGNVSYTDRDHEEDYVVPGRGEVRPEGWRIDSASAGPIRMARLVGDTNGSEAGTKTGVQFFFQDIRLRVSGPALPAAKMLAVSDAERQTFTNGCAANSGWRVLAFYGISMTQRAFYDKVASSRNLVSDNNWGVPPGTLRDRLREAGANVQERRVASKAAALDTVFAQIDAGKPIIALTGWGGKTVRDLYSPNGDWVSWDTGESTLHYVVVRGYDRVRRVIHVLDNGTPKTWSFDYFTSVLFWQPEMPHAAALFEAIAVRNATLIY